MLKEEFNNLVRTWMPDFAGISDSEYDVINRVYNFHPSISDTTGKEQVADLYVKCGYIIFLDMLPRANIMSNIEYELCEAKTKVRELKKQAEIARSDFLENINEVLRDF